jgi:succinate dehydrogenase / fumarate reductase flavoprotein subunit
MLLAGRLIMANIFDNFYKKGHYHAIDLKEYFAYLKRNRRIEVGLGSEYSNGGIVINEKMETNISGLYAAGECSSGVFGANRVADAVTEMIVQGQRAGRSAADYAKQQKPESDPDAASDIIRYAESLFSNENGISASEINRTLETITDKALNYVRNENDMSQGLCELQNLHSELANITLESKERSYNTEWVHAIHARNRIECTLISLAMAIQRKESRGTHIRSDFPQINHTDFLHRNIVQLISGEDHYSNRKPICLGTVLPTGSVDYEQYLSTIDKAGDSE